jgi:hypothetical protein
MCFSSITIPYIRESMAATKRMEGSAMRLRQTSSMIPTPAESTARIRHTQKVFIDSPFYEGK